MCQHLRDDREKEREGERVKRTRGRGNMAVLDPTYLHPLKQEE